MNPDGTKSTVRSMGINMGGRQVMGINIGGGVEVLIPTVHDQGFIMTDEEARKEFYRTGKHLGIFRSIQDSERFSKRLSRRSAYGKIPGFPKDY